MLVSTALASCLLAAAATIASPTPLRVSSPGSVIVFGDSLSDNGNGTYLLTNKTWPDDPAYFNGRFSNGPTWCEYVADSLGRQIRDDAFGGATLDNERVQGYTGRASDIPVPSVFERIDVYLKKHKPNARELYIVSGGGNDIFFGASKPGFSPEAFADGTAKRLVEGVRRLSEAGATRFLIPKASSLETTPYALSTDDTTRSVLKRYDAALRIALPTRVAAFQLKRPRDKLSITLFDPSLRKEQGKFKVVDEACLKGAYDNVPRSLCEKPDEYMYWDMYHPTTKAHSLIAQSALRALESADRHKLTRSLTLQKQQ